MMRVKAGTSVKNDRLSKTQNRKLAAAKVREIIPTWAPACRRRDALGLATIVSTSLCSARRFVYLECAPCAPIWSAQRIWGRGVGPQAIWRRTLRAYLGVRRRTLEAPCADLECAGPIWRPHLEAPSGGYLECAPIWSARLCAGGVLVAPRYRQVGCSRRRIYEN